MSGGDQRTGDQLPARHCEKRVYPNPSSSRQWTDCSGTVWHRRGNRGEPLDPKRVRRLLRRNGLPLATWKYGEVSWYWSSDEKERAAAALNEAVGPVSDIFPTEWKADDGTHMLMLEHR